MRTTNKEIEQLSEKPNISVFIRTCCDIDIKRMRMP